VEEPEEPGFKSYELLQALRKNAGISVKKLTDGKHVYYYSLNAHACPNVAYMESSRSKLYKFVLKLREVAKTKPEIAQEKFTRMADILLEVYEDEYNRNNVGLNKRRKKEKAIAEKEAEKIAFERANKQQSLEALVEIDDYYKLLKALREYFDLTQEDVSKLIAPTKPTSRELIRQLETRDTPKFIIFTADKIKTLINYYRSLTPIDDESIIANPENDLLRAQINRLYRLWEKETKVHGKSIHKSTRDFANKDLEQFAPYMAYLLIEAGYSNVKSAINEGLTLTIYEEILDKLHEPVAFYGRRITPEEFNKLEELYLTYLRQNYQKSPHTQPRLSLSAKNLAVKVLRPPESAFQEQAETFCDLVEKTFGTARASR
jgi:hypothetical protein